MNRIINFIIQKRLVIISIFAVLCVISAFCIPLVKVNYDSSKYLPDDTVTAKGLDIYYGEFGDNGTVSVMVKDLSVVQALDFKKQMQNIEGIASVVWLDDIVLPYKLENMTEEMFWNSFDGIKASLPADVQALLTDYYNGDAKYFVTMTDTDYDTSSTLAIKEIDKLGTVYLSGTTATAYNNVNVMMNETLKAALIIVPVIIIILLLATGSFFEPLLFLIVIGVSILLNMGTNIIFGEISNLTQATAAILQLALSMDYLIFLLNRYKQEKLKNNDINLAMKEAIKRSFMPILASSLTTIAGFVALMFMRYKIGFDMGIVLTKGILFSLISVFLLMPGLIIIFNKIIEKTSHKTLELNLKGLGGFLKKTRFVLPVLIAAIIIPAAIVQSSNTFIYGDSSSSGGAGSRLSQDKEMIEESFGLKNQLVILIPKESKAQELALSMALMQINAVNSVNSYSLAEAQAALQGQTLAQSVEANYLGENYYRIILNLNVPEEGEQSTAAIEAIDSTVDNYADNYYLVGTSSSVLDVKEVVETDYNIVNIVSIGLVALILLLTFKSILLPLILILVIQGSIWINMAIPYVMGDSIIFIGYMIVSCIQLGATIDYGILLSSRYLEYRRTENKFSAVINALKSSAHSIITSAGILCAAGFILGLVSTMPGISILGLLLGRGTLCSAILVLILLPQLLMLFDKGIKYTSLKRDFADEKEEKNT